MLKIWSIFVRGYQFESQHAAIHYKKSIVKHLPYARDMVVFYIGKYLAAGQKKLLFTRITEEKKIFTSKYG